MSRSSEESAEGDITSKYNKLIRFLSNQKEEFQKEAENSNNSMSIRNMFGTMELEIEQLLLSIDEYTVPQEEEIEN
jgi:hypothetical protein